ncbi:MAG: hypothetical protein AB1649_22880, partial [Chloroflexota bacterium]
MKRISLAFALGLLLALVFTIPSFAGGWAVITLDELPGQVIAGQPLEIGFMVRQHGVTPMDGLEPIVHASGPGTGKSSLNFTAAEQGQPGYYVATLTLPENGKWEWSIEAFTVNQPMPTLTVIAAPAIVEKPAEVSAPASVQWPQWVAGLLGAGAVLAGLVVSIQRKARWAIALILAGIVLSTGSLVSAAAQPEVEAKTDMGAGLMPVTSELSQVEIGRQLFIAKGCMMCHSHAETNALRQFGVDMGPNLTHFTASPEYLRLWLKDPKSVKSTAQMPQLEL